MRENLTISGLANEIDELKARLDALDRQSLTASEEEAVDRLDHTLCTLGECTVEETKDAFNFVRWQLCQKVPIVCSPEKKVAEKEAA